MLALAPKGISTLSMTAAQAQLQALVAAAPGAYMAAGLQLPPGYEGEPFSLATKVSLAKSSWPEHDLGPKHTSEQAEC